MVTAAPDDAVILRPPAPGRATDVEAATSEALRFPLDGQPLEELARGCGRATIVLQAPSLPNPHPSGDPRGRAIAVVSRALEALGVPTSSQTLLVASGLARRPSQRDVAALVPPEFARSFHGRDQPIVCNPRDAIRVFYGTGLDMAVFGSLAVVK